MRNETTNVKIIAVSVKSEGERRAVFTFALYFRNLLCHEGDDERCAIVLKARGVVFQEDQSL